MNRTSQDYYNPVYPQQPPYNPNCGVNLVYKTLPQNSKWQNIAIGHSSIKHIYTGIPNFYPYRRISRPVGTMYNQDYSTFHNTQCGKKRISYHAKMYPLTNRHVREHREYADYILPYVGNKK